MIELEEDGDAMNHHPGINNYDEQKQNKLEMRQRYYVLTILLLSIILFLTISILIYFIIITVFKSYPSTNVPTEPIQFYSRIETENILKHLQQFQNIALNNNNSRSPQFGYNETGKYIMNELSKYSDKLNIEIQPFQIEEYLIKEKPKFSTSNQVEYKLDIDFNQLSYSGSGNISNLYLKRIQNKGCKENDYINMINETKNYLFLIQRGECTFLEKVNLAIKYGAKSVLIQNQETELVQGTLGKYVPIPTFSISSTFKFPINNETLFNLYSNNEVLIQNTFNIITETKKGNPNEIIIIGSHLDSVSKGPGLNDNGSGSTSMLEILINLLQYHENEIENKIRFCFWGAEEIGLVGSTFYVNSLNNIQLKQISLNLNFDMIASPNYIRGVYDGKKKDKKCHQIQKIFEEFYIKQGLQFDLSEFDGRSDYGPFLEKGIPAGGLDSGAEKLKTDDQVLKTGGISGVPYDICYHLSCDTIWNVNLMALKEASQNAANAIYYFSTLKGLNSYLNQQNNLNEQNNERRVFDFKFIDGIKYFLK
eukprot:gene5703-9523_t